MTIEEFCSALPAAPGESVDMTTAVSYFNQRTGQRLGRNTFGRQVRALGLEIRPDHRNGNRLSIQGHTWRLPN